MKRTIIGFSLLCAALILAWFLKDLFISVFIIPVILGIYQMARLINSVPQIVWWIVLSLSSLAVIITNLKLPPWGWKNRKKIFLDRGRLGILESLVNESLNSSTYSGQQLSLLIINMDLKNRGQKEINIHKLDNYITSDSVPEEIRNFVRTQTRTTLEIAISYLNRTITGETLNDRSSQ